MENATARQLARQMLRGEIAVRVVLASAASAIELYGRTGGAPLRRVAGLTPATAAAVLFVAVDMPIRL